jgi:hypothetical protein
MMCDKAQIGYERWFHNSQNSMLRILYVLFRQLALTYGTLLYIIIASFLCSAIVELLFSSLIIYSKVVYLSYGIFRLDFNRYMLCDYSVAATTKAKPSNSTECGCSSQSTLFT